MKSTTLKGDVLRASVRDPSAVEVKNTPPFFLFGSLPLPPGCLIMPYNRAFSVLRTIFGRAVPAGLSLSGSGIDPAGKDLRQGETRETRIKDNKLFIILIK